MGETRSLLSVDESVDHPASDLVTHSDEFAVTVASRLDRRFWIRIERHVEGGTVAVTDFAQGARPPAELAAGLAMALRAVSPERVRALAFRDLVPAGAQAPLYPARIVQAADLVKQLGSAMAEHLETTVASFEMKPSRGKIDARVTFAPPPAPIRP